MPSIHPANTNRRERYSPINAKMIRLEKTLLLVWFAVNLVIGAFTVHEYGLSIDEPNNYRYARHTLEAYPSFFGILYEPQYNETFDGHGPAFVTIASIPIMMIRGIFPGVFAPDLWHFSYFITFQLTGLCLYWLTKRWFNVWTAWGVLVLFSTQPMLLGHAFINPKDIPFMFLLTLSIVSGYHLADGMQGQESSVSLEGTARTLTDKFRESDPQRKRRFFIYLVLALTVALILVGFSSQVNSLIGQIVAFFYTAGPDSWAGRIFNSLASRASNVTEEDYITKALRLFQRLERGALIAGVLFFLAYFGLLIANITLRAILSKVWAQRHKPGKSIRGLANSLRDSLHLGRLKIWFAEFFRALRNPRLILAGVALGLATGVRAIGPWAGLIVFLALLAKIRSRAWTTAIAYFLVTGIVTYLAWPRLWESPILRYLEGLGIISNFPNYAGRVLFNGHLYSIRDLPRSYLPVLLNIQFTEPLLLCIYIGLGVLGWRILRGPQRTDLLLYIGLGFGLPLFGMILLNLPLYHNLRQVLFLMPAMFILAAFALELIFSKLTQNWVRILLIAALALPGIYSSVALYPYEYVYYNSLVGGPAGVRNRYELDYWRISLREAALELNELAPHGSRILVTRSAGLFEEYGRPDLVLDKVIGNALGPSNEYDYAVQVTRWDRWDLYPTLKNVVIIERAGAVLATVKAVKNK
jgi:4-amino-4-deoxy-L-arabinose transferase-like glycosyltransferase